EEVLQVEDGPRAEGGVRLERGRVGDDQALALRDEQLQPAALEGVGAQARGGLRRGGLHALEAGQLLHGARDGGEVLGAGAGDESGRLNAGPPESRAGGGPKGGVPTRT